MNGKCNYAKLEKSIICPVLYVFHLQVNWEFIKCGLIQTVTTFRTSGKVVTYLGVSKINFCMINGPN